MTPTILCVDDDTGITAMLHDSLVPRGYRVLAAGTVHEALDVIHSTKIDLILLDLLLPDNDGLSLFEQLADEPQYRRIPVIVASGCTAESARGRSIQRGAVAYLPKPYQIPQLLTLLRRMAPEPDEVPVAGHGNG